jgi:hypothetical protein
VKAAAIGIRALADYSVLLKYRQHLPSSGNKKQLARFSFYMVITNPQTHTK